ncbi:MAG: toxic anion resistance protein [Methylomonas sp.]|nr:MAG: toxic anion resistance protein [Methylomonas sp.]PPD26682.1 MAG: toxic anion resistance protein [Methylomonas sp.]PPD37701.1 MAG: toxic anion resistance protein [Methylomonas sp.]PPD38490.1 MAG: toxic anion resistance protein [Methylomonas sp.]PPD55893.1 MAG: toxic anion resistance protein [Methylomonas sp.]
MSNTPELTPPESLTAPAPVMPIAKEQAVSMVKLPAETVAKLDVRVAEFIDTVLAESTQSPAFKAKVDSVHNLASPEIREAAAISNRLLARPAQALDAGAFNEGSKISRSLVDLRNQVETLDPARQGNLLQPRKILGLFPWGNRLHDYFQQYQSAQSHIDAIIVALYAGQDELRKDNAAIEEEKVNAWRTMEKLEQYIHVGRSIDAALERKLAEIEPTDPEKARVIREEMLFYLRQKVQDLMTQLAVTIQGYLAMDLIRKNNLELIKGVDRATTTTVSALRTAVIVAQALANQKLVLDQIGALRSTTGNMIESTSILLKQQAGQIHEQASEASVSLDKLSVAFKNIYDTMDMVANYKLEALSSMKKTVESLSGEIEKTKGYLDKTREDTLLQAKETLRITDENDIVL